MKNSVQTGDYAAYVAAAGILSHYVGDACQPLHGSMYADGFQDQAEEVETRTGTLKKVWPAKGIHSAYETKMIDEKAEDLFPLIHDLLGGDHELRDVQDGKDSALATIQLMHAAQKLLPPKKLCQRYIALGEGASKPVIDGLWKSFGEKTAQTMANGALLLAALWTAAWTAGGGDEAEDDALAEIDTDTLEELYRSKEFVPSLDLNHIAAVLNSPSPSPAMQRIAIDPSLPASNGAGSLLPGAQTLQQSLMKLLG